MRNAYAVLGLSFIIVFGSAFLLYQRAHAPERAIDDAVVTTTPTSSATDRVTDSE